MLSRTDASDCDALANAILLAKGMIPSKLHSMPTTSYLKQLFDLSGKTAVVIGGTGELCGTIAVGLARAGAEVILGGRIPEGTGIPGA